MSEQTVETNRRRFVRIDVTEDVRAVDETGQEIGRIEKVGAGGMQIRLSESGACHKYPLGSRMTIQVMEPGDVQQKFKVEVRVCDNNILGVEFLS